jgi:hypothetical protein
MTFTVTPLTSYTYVYIHVSHVYNVPGKRAVQTSEPSTPPTFRTSTCAQLKHIIECYIHINVQNYVAPIVSFLHVQELCLASLHLVQRARAWRLRPDRSLP